MKISKLYNTEDFYMEWILKKYEGSEQSLLSTSSILEWTLGGHFNNITKIKKTYYNRPYIKVDDNKYIFIENIKGKKIKITDKKQVLEATRCLARFHRASEGYVMPCGIKIEANWGKSMEKFKSFNCSLEKYWDMIEKNGARNTFEKETLPYIKLLYKLSRKTIDFFRSEEYIDSIERSMKKREICINDIPGAFMRVSPSQKMYITKIFSMGYNMCEEDIASLARRYIEETGNIELLDEIISEYNSIRYIDNTSRQNIRNMALFPETPIKIVSKYMKKGLYREDMLENFLNSSKVYEKLNMEV